MDKLLAEYQQRAKRDMEIIDALPYPVRCLVHDYGVKAAQLYLNGVKPEAIRVQLAA